MPVRLMPVSGDMVTGQTWLIRAATTDARGYLASTVTPSLTVTAPSGAVTSPAFTWDGYGWTAPVVVDAAGRWIAQAALVGDAAGTDAVAAYVADITASGGYPTVFDVHAYLGETSVDENELQAVLDAEAAAQRSWCGERVVYPPDLREALLRRVSRNLAARSVPLSTFNSFDGGGVSVRVPGTDAEIERLEGPYRLFGIA